MRKWLVVAGLAIVALVGLLVLAATNLDRWLTANRELLAERAGDALGRKVSFSEVGLSFRGGLGVRVTDLRVGDDPAFSDEDFLQAGAIDVLIRIWPALVGDIEVERVVVREPSIRVLRTAKGLSTDSLGGGGGGAGDEAGGRTLLVALVDVRDGAIRYEDRTVSPPTQLELTALDVRASDLSPGQPVSLELSAALLGSQTLPGGLETSGPVELEATAEGDAQDLRFDVSLDAAGAAVKLGESFDKAAGVPMRVSLRGERKGDAVELESAELVLGDALLRGKASISSVEKTLGDFSVRSPRLPLAIFGAGEAGEELRDVTLDGSLAGPRISARLRSPAGVLRGTAYRDLAANLVLAGGRVEIETASLRAWDGELEASGSYDTTAREPRFDVRTQVKKVRVEQLLAERSPALARVLSGELDTRLELRGAGSSWDQIRPLLNGSGDLRLADGILREFNAAGDALRAFAALPQFAASGLGRFLREHPQLVGAEDMEFRELASVLQIRDGWLNLPGFRVEAVDYELRGARRGRLSLAGELDLPIDVVLSQALSEEALIAVSGFRYLRGSDGRVALPVLLRGMPPAPSLDPEAVSRLALQVGSGLLVEQLLGKPRRDAAAPAETGEPGETAGAQEGDGAPAPTAEEILIREGIRGLEGLLGGGRDRDR